MSENSTKSSSFRNNSSSNSGGHSHAIPHAFSNIVNKVESLINKMNYDKHNYSYRNNIDKYCNSHKENKKKLKSQNEYKCNKLKDSCEMLNGKQRSTSMDSLNNLSDGEIFDDRDMNDIGKSNTNTTSTNNTNDIYSDSDDAEIAHITGTTSVQVHRRIELDQLTDETIREFNEQCSSLSHDLDFYNSWQNEEELEQSSTQKQAEFDIFKTSTQCEEFEIQENNDAKDTNNNVCSISKVDTQEWLNTLETIEHQEQDLFDNRETNNRPLTHIQQIVNDITQYKNKQQKYQNNHCIKHNNVQHDNENEIEINNSSETSSNSVSSNFINQTSTANNGNITKTRRSSVASSGSVGRMETILEEPSDCKISVKEILQRFETMNKTEVHIYNL